MSRSKFIILGEPKSKERPRFTRNGRAYTPQGTRDAEKRVADEYAKQSGFFFEGSVKVSIVFGLTSARRRDIDNMAKLILDALNKVAYNDDTQVHKLNIEKARSSIGWTLVVLEDWNGRNYDSPEIDWKEI